MDKERIDNELRKLWWLSVFSLSMGISALVLALSFAFFDGSRWRWPLVTLTLFYGIGSLICGELRYLRIIWRINESVKNAQLRAGLDNELNRLNTR